MTSSLIVAPCCAAWPLDKYVFSVSSIHDERSDELDQPAADEAELCDEGASTEKTESEEEEAVEAIEGL